jgi:hypothetical protein
MKLDDLREEHLVEVVRLYEEHCGPGRDIRNFRDAMYQTPSMVLEHLRKHGGEEYRIGSRWDSNSKIYFETDSEGNVAVRFYSNFDPRDRQGKEYEEAEKSGETFVKAAMQYLSSK